MFADELKRLVQVGDCTCSDHECGQCMRPVGPTLTVEQIENVRSWVRRGLTIGNFEAFDELCDFAIIGLQCVTAEPVAWQIHLYEPCDVYMNKDDAELEFKRRNEKYPEKDRKLCALIVKPEAK